MQVSQTDSFEALQALRIGWRQEKKGMFQFYVEWFLTQAKQYLFVVYLMMLSVAWTV
jgi:hypothetical protein